MNTTNSETIELSDEFASSGYRLRHILDKINFKPGRGRIDEFHRYLQKALPEKFGELKYTTVQSWFGDSSPPMAKVEQIIDLLADQYVFDCDLALVKTWWKVGGFYPFSDARPNETKRQPDDKLQFKIMSLVTDAAGDNFEDLSAEDLIQIKEKAIKFADDFADPFLTEVPIDYIRMVIAAALKDLKSEK